MARKHKNKVLPAQATDTKTGKLLPRQSSEITPDQMTPLWSFSFLDIGSTWCWSNMTQDDLRIVLARLKNLETMTWAEIKGPKKSHNVEKFKLIKEAQDRLEEIGLDYLEELFSLRITGEHRVWGVLNNHILQILWWDPTHEICPAPLRNT